MAPGLFTWPLLFRFARELWLPGSIKLARERFSKVRPIDCLPFPVVSLTLPLVLVLPSTLHGLPRPIPSTCLLSVPQSSKRLGGYWRTSRVMTARHAGGSGSAGRRKWMRISSWCVARVPPPPLAGELICSVYIFFIASAFFPKYTNFFSKSRHLPSTFLHFSLSSPYKISSLELSLAFSLTPLSIS